MMGGENLSCSIVIRAFNEARHIRRLLEGILRQSVRGVEIILVDSGSSDGTVEIARAYPVHILHISPQEFTFGRSLNRGIRAASHNLVVIASAHVYPVYPDWLEHLLAPFADPQVALVYGKQRGAPTTRFSEHQIFQRWYGDQSNWHQNHPFCNNANAAIRRSLWERHPYDETLTGLEDIAWAKTMQEAGYAIAYVAEAEVIHVHEETLRGVYNRYRREAMAFKRIFPKEEFRFLDFLRLATANIFSDAWHAWREGLFPRVLSDILGYRLAQFWGVYQGHRHPSLVTEELRKTFYYPRQLGSKGAPRRREIQPLRYE